jgi:hypothetical protein
LDNRRRYREAEAELCADVCPPYSLARRKTVRRQLREAMLHVLPALPEAEEQLDQLLENDMPLGMLTDVIGYILDIDVGRKVSLLSEVDVLRRAKLLLRHLSEATAELTSVPEPALCFPPEFSTN